MSAIEQRARELLARMEKAKRNERGHWCDARAAVDSACQILPQLIAALTPPEGWVSPDDLLEAQDRAFYDGMSKCACPIPEGYVLVSAELLEDLAAEAESGIHQTVFVPAKRERRMAFVKEARALIAARLEAK